MGKVGLVTSSGRKWRDDHIPRVYILKSCSNGCNPRADPRAWVHDGVRLGWLRSLTHGTKKFSQQKRGVLCEHCESQPLQVSKKTWSGWEGASLQRGHSGSNIHHHQTSHKRSSVEFPSLCSFPPVRGYNQEEGGRQRRPHSLLLLSGF